MVHKVLKRLTEMVFSRGVEGVLTLGEKRRACSQWPMNIEFDILIC